jgi:hypothetical protein
LNASVFGFGFITAFLLIMPSVHAQDDRKLQTVAKRFGTHSIAVSWSPQDGVGTVIADDQAIGKIENTFITPEFLGPYQFDSSTVVFIGTSSGGTACAETFNAVTFNPKASLSQQFGTCSDIPAVLVAPHAVTLRVPYELNGDSYQETMIDASGVHVHEVPTNLQGPDLTETADLGVLVLSIHGRDFFTEKAAVQAMQQIVTPKDFEALRHCYITDGPAPVGDYVVARSHWPRSCGDNKVLFVFDHNRHAWVGIQADDDDHSPFTWYGTPPTAAIEAAFVFDKQAGN